MIENVKGDKMAFTRVADITEISPGKMKMSKIGELEVLVANVNGDFYAIPNRCTHMQGDLSQGTLDGKIVTCPRHGSQFDVTTGKSLRGPKIVLRFTTDDQPSFKVKVEGKDILVDVG